MFREGSGFLGMVKFQGFFNKIMVDNPLIFGFIGRLLQNWGEKGGPLRFPLNGQTTITNHIDDLLGRLMDGEMSFAKCVLGAYIPLNLTWNPQNLVVCI